MAACGPSSSDGGGPRSTTLSYLLPSLPGWGFHLPPMQDFAQSATKAQAQETEWLDASCVHTMWPHALLNPARIGTAIVLGCLLAFAAPALAVTWSKPHHHHAGSKGYQTSGPEPGPPTTPTTTPTPKKSPTPTPTPYTAPPTTTPPVALPYYAPAPAAAPTTHTAASKHKPRPKNRHHAAPAAAKPKPKPPPAPAPAAKLLTDPVVNQSSGELSLALTMLVLLALAAALAATAFGTKVARSRRLAAADSEAASYESPSRAGLAH